MENGEIDLLDLDEENESYYEVELWENGDCNGHFFHYKRDAIRFFGKNAKHQSDCVKFHQAYCLGGDCKIIKENRQW